MSERSGSDDLGARLESASHQRIVEDNEYNAKILRAAARIVERDVPPAAFVQALELLDPDHTFGISTGDELKDLIIGSLNQRAGSEQAIADAAKNHL